MKLLDREVLLKALVGSHNYNLATESSDKDYKAYTSPTFEELYLKEQFSKQLITDTEDIEIHDIRKLVSLLYKSNINYMEILVSNELVIPDGNPEINEIVKRKNEIFKMNLPYFFSACKGMHFQKMKQLNGGTEGTQHLVDKFGYDTKQAQHAYRVLKVTVDFAKTDFEDFKSAITYQGEDEEFMRDIKRGVFKQEVFENFINHYYNSTFVHYENLYKSFEPNEKLKNELEEIVMSLVKKEGGGLMSKQYNEDSIKSLGILGGVRAKPASIGLESHNHTFLEILGNSIDEAKAGYGDKIIIIKHEDGAITVRDFGRGVPMDKNDKGEYAYKKVFDELWSGGKYDNNEEGEGNYQYSLGTNGVGATGTNYTSDFFWVSSYSKNWIRSVEYEKGLESSNGMSKVSNPDVADIGTSITWRPSKECFRGNGEIDTQFIITTLQDQSVVNGGLKFTFINYKDKREDLESGEMIPYEMTFYYENGVTDYIESISNKEHALTDVVFLSNELKGKDNESDKDYKIKADIYFSFNRETSFSRYYHNSSWLENGGTPEDFIKNSFTFVIDKCLKDNNLYNKGEKKITFEDVSDSLVVVSSTYSTISLFSDQTKKKITSEFMKQSITQWLREQLTIYFIENPNEAKLIFAQVLVNKRSREKSEKTRLDIKKKLSGTVNNLTSRVDGFVGCKSNDKEKTELYVVEGKSALGSTQQGRDAKIQAIYALRGKILNCLKADYDRIFKNDIIIDLIKIIGCGIEVKTKQAKDLNTFDIKNLKWSKIIIATDADVDGFHIRTLILAMIYRLMPTLIEEGYVYIAESPLYEISQNDKSVFAYSDKEKDEIVSGLKGAYTIQRSKGLGENTAEMMWETTMNPETRKLIKVTPSDATETIETFELFLGDNLEGRKEYIEENLYKYIDESLD